MNRGTSSDIDGVSQHELLSAVKEAKCNFVEGDSAEQGGMERDGTKMVDGGKGKGRWKGGVSTGAQRRA